MESAARSIRTDACVTRNCTVKGPCSRRVTTSDLLRATNPSLRRVAVSNTSTAAMPIAHAHKHKPPLVRVRTLALESWLAIVGGLGARTGQGRARQHRRPDQRVNKNSRGYTHRSGRDGSARSGEKRRRTPSSRWECLAGSPRGPASQPSGRYK